MSFLSKYEHLQEALIQEESEGPVWNDLPFPRVPHRELTKTWITRRRKDGKLFLAKEINDPYSLVSRVGESLKRLLHHSNLICLIDIVKDSQVPGAGAIVVMNNETDRDVILGKGKDYMVWERCPMNLNRLLRQEGGYNPHGVKIVIPESLCWHVLDGVSKALLWLHCGVKDIWPFGVEMKQDEDWQTVLTGPIRPQRVFLMEPERNEMYGKVKLGEFAWANVVNDAETTVEHDEEVKRLDYVSQEAYQTKRWSQAAEIWSFGATIYHMMTGKPPQERTFLRYGPQSKDGSRYYIDALPQQFSSELKDLVYAMLHFDPLERPKTEELSKAVSKGMNIWIEKTEEGKEYGKSRSK